MVNVKEAHKDCAANHMVGDTFEFAGCFMTKGYKSTGESFSLCIKAMDSLFPWINALQYDAKFNQEDPTLVVNCNDPFTPVTFELRRELITDIPVFNRNKTIKKRKSKR